MPLALLAAPGRTITADELETRCIESALTGLSPNSRRVYSARIAAYMDWANGSPLDREHVKKYIRSLELRGLTAQVQNQALAALKRLTVEASELGWISSSAAAQIKTVKAKKITGVRTGRWLSAAQTRALLESPDLTTLAGKRDAAVLALLVGCGLRRAEACGLETAQLKKIEVDRTSGGTSGRTIITNLIGKGGRVRSVSVPVWAVAMIEDWTAQIPGVRVGLNGRLLRSISRDGDVSDSLSPSAIRDIVQKYGLKIGIPDLNPHDLRRTHARLARLGGAPLETIQHSLGHASSKTTEIYTRTGEEANAGDFIRL